MTPPRAVIVTGGATAVDIGTVPFDPRIDVRPA